MTALIPPHLVLRDFLDEETLVGLLAYTLRHEADFTPTGLGHGAIDPAKRFSMPLTDIGPFKAPLKDRMLALLPEFIATLRATPVPEPKLEIELVAHGDGDFYKRRVDTRTAADQHSLRFLSAMYYFHAEPKGFSGGTLRLYAIGSEITCSDIEPAHNSLVVFPSWTPHEVMPLHCPSKRFADSRFAINFWFHGARPASPAR